MRTRSKHSLNYRKPTDFSPWVLFILIALFVTGCAPTRIGGDGTSVEDALDESRAKNMELEKQVAALERDLELRVAEVDKLNQQMQRKSHSDQVDDRDIPHVVKIGFGRYTAAIDKNDDGKDDLVRVVLLTVDQKDRFIPVAGTAKLQVIAPNPGGEPKVIAAATFDSKAFEKTYREGFTGAHYTLEAKLIAKHTGDASATVEFVDAASGAKLTHTQVIKIDAK